MNPASADLPEDDGSPALFRKSRDSPSGQRILKCYPNPDERRFPSLKAYFLPLGAGADRSLPAMLTALSCGAAREAAPEISILRITVSAPGPLVENMIADLNACHRLFAEKDAFAFFRTSFSLSSWQPGLPGRDAMAPGETGHLLLSALRGENQPLSFRTDPEAVEWSLTALLENRPEEAEPFFRYFSAIQADLSAGEDVRVMLACDLNDGCAAGLAVALLRFFRTRFAGFSPFIGLIGQVRSRGASGWEELSAVNAFLTALRDRELVRLSDDRNTLGADAFWLLGLPSGLMAGEESGRLLDWASARVLGGVFGDARRPSSGLHTREIPGVLTLRALDQEAKPAAAFLRGAFWCLSDLFPALRQYFEHPVLLRSLAPATRNGLFRRLFRDGKEPAELALTERTLKAMLLEALSLLRSLPAPLREADSATALWQEAVKACGRCVTLGAEYDVRRKEAEDSGVDKVAPVHRVSLSDTEEEQIMRSLGSTADELARLLGERAAVFDRLGGFRARQSLEDCLRKCRAAEDNAREKLVAMPAGTPEERYALGLQERRVRLLQAAVARCEADIADAVVPEVLRRPGTYAPSSPFAGEILDPAMAELGFQMLTGEGEAAENASKALRDGIQDLLKGYPMNDAKNLLKNLLSVCRQPDAMSPLRELMAGVFSVCGIEAAGVRFQSAGELPSVPLLPDLKENDRFFTVAAAPEKLLAPPLKDRTAEKRGILALLLLRLYRRRAGGEAELCFQPCEKTDSVLSRVFLSSRGAEKAVLACLRPAADETARLLPLAILFPGAGLEPARLSAAHRDLIPSFCRWIDRDSLLFRDPCMFLGDGDRRILTEQITRMRASLNASGGHAFRDFLGDWYRDIMRVSGETDAGRGLPDRLRAVCGLYRLPVWKKELRREAAAYETGLPSDPVCAALTGLPDFPPAGCDVREEITYVFRNTPIARESARWLLESSRLPEEAHLLSLLGEECEILRLSSDDYHEALEAGLTELTRKYPSADPEAVKAAESLLKEAREPIREAETDLVWPWDTASASVLTILTECLGSSLAGAALRPFSDRLALFPARGGEVIGDVLFSGMCMVRHESARSAEKSADRSADEPAGAPDASAVFDSPGAPGVSDVSGFPQPESVPLRPEESSAGVSLPPESPAVAPDAVLPPLSRDFAAAVCCSPQGQSLIQDGFLRFEAVPEGIRVTMTLEGAFTLRLSRVYSPEEQTPLYAHDLPTLAVWPSFPFADGDWNAYFTYAHGNGELRFSVLAGADETPLAGAAPRFALRTEYFPLCFLIEKEGQVLGALPNLLPRPEMPEGKSWIANLDFGASAASVVLENGESRFPMQGPVRMRTLLRNPASSEELLWREFLPAVPVSALLPCALRIFRNDLSESDLPLRDASIFMSSSLQDVLDISPQALYTDLKWGAEKGRAVRLYLHQVMLMAALEARCGGASDLRWRAAVPDEMPPEGRERLADLIRDLADEISQECGIPLPAKAPPAAFASESAALGHYFRFCSPEETRGGFMALDLGADTADLSLFLRGRDQAVRVSQLPLGVHYMLLPALLRQPSVLTEDFGFWEDEAFRRDLANLQALLDRAARDPAALRQARYGLDAMIADHYPLLMQLLAMRRADGAPGRTGALLLLHFCFLMMISGLTLLQISADAQKNDFLPERMTLFLAGRGSLLMEGLSLEAKTSLWKMLTMFRNPRVSSLNLLFSAEKKMEIPVGLSLCADASAALPRPAQAPVSMALRPEELLPEFLLRFRREFPGEAQLLFPGIYAADYYDPFTPAGRQMLAHAVHSAFGDREIGRPYPALIACLNHMMEMIREGTVF